MKTVLSLPPESISYFHHLYTSPDYVVGHDPIGHRVGSGGGLIHLVRELNLPVGQETFLFINAGGESRRLPAYGAYGKVLLPIPVLKHSRGQRIDQRLLDLQEEYLSRIAHKLGGNGKVVVASGDCYVDLPEKLPPIPEADIVCLGLRGDLSTASKHGVFVVKSESPEVLEYMLQKPTVDQMRAISSDHTLLIDSGVWILSPKAIEALEKECSQSPSGYFDLYSDWGRYLGIQARKPSESSSKLSAKVWSPQGASFFHFGSSSDLISSMYALQNLHNSGNAGVEVGAWKLHKSVFALNAKVAYRYKDHNELIWIENSYIPSTWKLSSKHIITGIPTNSRSLTIPEGWCIDVFRTQESSGWVLRTYDFDDKFRGKISAPETLYHHRPVSEYIQVQELDIPDTDIYEAPLFPILDSKEALFDALEDLLSGRKIRSNVLGWLSPSQCISQNDLIIGEQQRQAFLLEDILAMRRNWTGSVLYRSDLGRVAEILRSQEVSSTDLSPLPTDVPEVIHMHDAMMQSLLWRDRPELSEEYSRAAHDHLREWVDLSKEYTPPTLDTHLFSDQIVWARSPIRMDIGGAWSDTPPYCMLEGGSVVNMSLLINGQEPIQVYIKRSERKSITLRSIDLGSTEEISDVESLTDYRKIKSPFSIPKAALTILGLPSHIARHTSWAEGIDALGGGMEITLMSALPAGSGLGVSSILASTVLSALNSYFDLGWMAHDIGGRTLLLEQLLTTGGGWQDQYGALFGGIKLLTTRHGSQQIPEVTWLPTTLLTAPEWKPCHLLFYTGQTRVAKGILGNIVRKMFLNDKESLSLLKDMKLHAEEIASALSHHRFEEYGKAVKTSLAYNCRLDAGTLTPEIEEMIRAIDDYALGYKLGGAGGGGFLYIVAKDPQAASRIRTLLTQPQSYLPPTSRMVEMSLSEGGIMVTKS